MATGSDTPSRFKSRFSLLSLIPSRHPPLIISHPQPALPLPSTRQISSRHPTIVTTSDTVSPVHSEYPDTSFSSPLNPPRRLGKDQKNESGRRATPSPPRRPPPLDLKKTIEAYPGVVGVIPTAGTIAPPLPPKRLEPTDNPPVPFDKLRARKEWEKGGRLQAEKKKREPTVVDDLFDVAEVEPGHEYTSWKTGRVSIRPGQVIPHGSLLGTTPTIRGRDPGTSRFHLGSTCDEMYDSVLHNVLLTPTYLGRSPIDPPTPSPDGESSRGGRRTTLLSKTVGAVRDRTSRWIPKGILKPSENEAGRSVREMREREEREMSRFRQAARPVRIDARGHNGGETWGYASSSSPIGEVSHVYTRRSPGRTEWAVGGGGSGSTGEAGKHWRETKRQEDRLKRKQRLFKYGIALAILCLAALTIGLCTSLLTKSSKSSASSPSSSTESTGTSTSASSAPSASASSTPTSRTLESCLDLYTSQAPTTSYPCSYCVPLLSSTTNDYLSPLSNGNATGVGSALQFCAMMDLYKDMPASNSSATRRLIKRAWGDGEVCGWDNVNCDPRGRVTSLTMKYPDIPAKLPTSLDNIVSLAALHIMGNSTVPTGAFPSTLLSLQNLTILDLEYTALTGPLASVDFSGAKNLGTLYLVNNGQLGRALPDLRGNEGLVTLAVTGQGLESVFENSLPSSLTYLDLSYNNLTGIIPSFSSLTSLATLYLTNNAFAQAPSSLPGSLSSLSLTANPSLTGSMPAGLCSNAALSSCDLRSTKLAGSNVSTIDVSASGITNARPSGTSLGGAVASPMSVCGSCRFV